MKSLSRKKNRFYEKFVAPKSLTPDEQRRESVLNILLTGLIPISLLTDVATVTNHAANKSQASNSVVPVLGFTVMLIIFLWLSRSGFYKQVSYVLLAIMLLGAISLAQAYSFSLPGAQLAFIIILVLSGILLSARAALLMTAGLAVLMLVLGYQQVNGNAHPDMSWVNEKLKFADSVGFVAGLFIIGFVSWLSNREIDRSLKRARRSEAALALERDQLEIKIIERTKELERAQLVRVMELQRLAEFGRLSAGLLHDVANPLTVASLNLKELGGKSEDILVRQAVQSLNYIERFLESARKQLKAQSSKGDFVVLAEIKQVITILRHRAREASVKLELKPGQRIKMFADPVKFSQITANLILNAIEAYGQDEALSKRVVTIEAKQQNKWTIITVTDRGRGLSDQQMERIFDTFYSTKDTSNSNMGIGLATVKRLAENDFSGHVKVTSSKRGGTRFTVYLKDSPGEDK